MPVNVVTLITQEYWRDVREAISELKHDRVHVTCLGDFTVKHWKLDDTLEMLHKVKVKFPSNLEKIMDDITRIEALKNGISEEQQRKEFIKTHKRFIHETKRNEKDLELKVPNSRGNKK